MANPESRAPARVQASRARARVRILPATAGRLPAGRPAGSRRSGRASSSFEPRADVGPFTARTETKNESAAEVVGIVVGEMSRLSAADVPETELTPRKAVLIGSFAQSLETTSGIVNRVSNLALYKLPLSDINRYISGVQSVSAEDVRKFAATNIGGKDTSVVVVGDAKQFVEPLRKQYEDVEVIPLAELDLASPTLRVRKAKK